MKTIHCAACGKKLPANTHPAGEWVTTDGTRRIPLYYCCEAHMFCHIFALKTKKEEANK